MTNERRHRYAARTEVRADVQIVTTPPRQDDVHKTEQDKQPGHPADDPSFPDEIASADDCS